MERSKISLRKWAFAIYLCTTSLKLHRDLAITQKSAWLIVYRIREVRARAVSHVNRSVLAAFIYEHTKLDAMVYTDESPIYDHLPNHETVRKSVGEYVAGQAHRNGTESFWAMLKRAYRGTYRHFSPKHLQRYVDRMATRHSLREMDAAELVAEVAARMVGRRLTYAILMAGGPAYPRR
ncbi:MAG: transposase [Chloroflexi bacterium]|nr:transposase [Chloroflexota bacterium]